MPRTCIICGEAAGSGEHVFPAALGGRRTDKGIYCRIHDNGYSNLAGVLAVQLRAINALIGVVNDHTKEIPETVMTDLDSGRSVTISADKARFTEPVEVGKTMEGTRQVTRMSFSSKREAEKWAEKQRALGLELELGPAESTQPYYLGQGKMKLTLGGPEGLRAIGYLAQTYLAHYFPDVARSPHLELFKVYTLWRPDGETSEETREEFVWWDFDTPKETWRSAFELGHRIIVGLDPDEGAPYARISLFSALHFAVQFCPVPGLSAKSVIVDIDPLANHPPGDILERREERAFGSVVRPTVTTASLSAAINDTRAKQLFDSLMGRIADFQMLRIGRKVWKEIEKARRMDASRQQNAIAKALEAESQSILNGLRHVFGYMEQDCPDLAWIARTNNEFLKSDQSFPNGISNFGLTLIEIARNALLAKILEEDSAGTLDAEQLGLLIAGGPGAALTCKAVVAAQLGRLYEQ